MRQTYTIRSEVRGERYRALLRASLQYCASAQLVVRLNMPLAESGRALLERLSTFQLDTRRVTEWPGTKLLEGVAELHVYRMDEALMNVLGAEVDDLYGWRQPRTPEDLSLVREDGSLWLGSIAHEGDGFMTLDEAEAALVYRAVPDLTLTVDADETDT